jgi:hypothetical protein
MPAPDYTLAFMNALGSIRKILESTHPQATPAEKLIRIAWSIGEMPAEIRKIITDEAQTRTIIGWSSGLRPTDWDAEPPAEKR